MTPGRAVGVKNNMQWKSYNTMVYEVEDKIMEYTCTPLIPSKPYMVACPKMTLQVATHNCLLWVHHQPNHAHIFWFLVSGLLGWISVATSPTLPATSAGLASSVLRAGAHHPDSIFWGTQATFEAETSQYEPQHCEFPSCSALTPSMWHALDLHSWSTQ